MKTDRGSMSVEVVILTPVLVLFLVFVSYVGRTIKVQDDLNRAADIAARVASQSQARTMAFRATQTAHASMNHGPTDCVGFRSRVTTRRVNRIVQVNVHTSCRLNIGGLSLLGIPSPSLTGSSSEVVDVYRHP